MVGKIDAFVIDNETDGLNGIGRMHLFAGWSGAFALRAD
jgi:hypothetical protein